MRDLPRGTRIEICPFKHDSGRAFPMLADLDGTAGVIQSLSNAGGELRALVKVESRVKNTARPREIPAKALKVVPS